MSIKPAAAQFLESTPFILTPGTEFGATASIEKAEGKLTPEERAVCNMMGQSEEQFLSSKAEIANL